MAKTAIVYIDGEVSSDSYSMASISSIRQSIEWQGQFDEIQVTINSCGGDIAEGLGIYDLLRSYEKPITTIVIGQCCSAATVIFLAGSTRIISENVVAFMIHQARGGPRDAATADELRLIADFIERYDQRMAAIYMSVSGQSAETVAEWMSKDTYMTADEALSAGIATIVSKPVEAKTYYTPRPAIAAVATVVPPVTPATSESISNPSNPMTVIKNQFARIMASISAKMSGVAVKAVSHTLKDGSKIDFEQAGDSYAEEDGAKIGSDPAPDKTYELENGVKVTVKDGKISSINTDTTKDVEAVADPAPTTDPATTADPANAPVDQAAEIARLTAENATLQTTVTALQTTMNTVKAQMSLLSGEAVSKDIKIPVSNTQPKSVTAQATTTSAEDERATMLAKRKALWYKEDE